MSSAYQPLFHGSAPEAIIIRSASIPQDQTVQHFSQQHMIMVFELQLFHRVYMPSGPQSILPCRSKLILAWVSRYPQPCNASTRIVSLLGLFRITRVVSRSTSSDIDLGSGRVGLSWINLQGFNGSTWAVPTRTASVSQTAFTSAAPVSWFSIPLRAREIRHLCLPLGAWNTPRKPYIVSTARSLGPTMRHGL